MNSSVPVTTQCHDHRPLTPPSKGSSAQAHARPPFSRASHFALLLLPALGGVALSLINDGNGPFLFRLGIFALFLFGITTALVLLYGAEQTEDESDNCH
jgi:hypothetical protein